jgi:hypothetical protein
MTQSFGVTNTDYNTPLWMGSHPAVTMDGTMADGQTLSAGTVLGKITASGLLTQLAPGASDGSENAMGILMDNLSASGADEPCIYLAHGEVSKDQVIWPGGITEAQKTEAVRDLMANNIYAK